jgi:hypothetical protein
LEFHQEEIHVEFATVFIDDDSVVGMDCHFLYLLELLHACIKLALRHQLHQTTHSFPIEEQTGILSEVELAQK